MKKSNTILIVGLGNPGENYANSPHNAGFLVVDKLLETWSMKHETCEKWSSKIAEYKFGKNKIILAKPLTFMNNSGVAVKKIVSSFGFQVSSDLWVIHDDVDLELGKIKIVKNRGSAGHRGVEDIIQKLGTKEFVRFRIGVRPPRLPQKRSKTLMNKFVTAKLSKEENELFERTMERCRDAVLFALENGVEKTTSIYNAK